jgi:hypothetical protein
VVVAGANFCDSVEMNKDNITPEQLKQEWEQRAFGGNEPFTDGVTPEMAQARLDRIAEYKNSVERASKKLQLKPREDGRRPFLAISRDLSGAVFNNPLTEEELIRTKRVLLDVDKHERRDCAFAWGGGFQARFFSMGLRLLASRSLNQPNAAQNIFRIADMARGLFWKYRKPGWFGDAITDAHLNYSVKRMTEDVAENPEIVKLLEEYRDLMLIDGAFSKEGKPRRIGRPANPNKVKEPVFRTATLARQLKAITEICISAMKRLDALEQSHNLTLDSLTTCNTRFEISARRVDALEGTTAKLQNILELFATRLDTQAPVAYVGTTCSHQPPADFLKREV